MNREKETVVICPKGKPAKVKIPLYALQGKEDYENTHHCSEDRDEHNSELCNYFNKCNLGYFKIIVKNRKIKIKQTSQY